MRDYDRLAGVNGGTESASLLPAVLRIVHGIEADGGGNFAGVERMIDLLSAEQERSAADKSGSRAGKPPWLLMAMMSAARDGPTMPVARHQDQYPKATHRTARNPVTAAAEAGLRSALEMRVAESLRSIDTVRLLLQDPAGSVIRPEVEGGVSGGPHVARIGTDKKLASLMAEVDPATALFDGILREWLACRRGDDYRGGRDDIGDLGASGDPGLSRREVGVKHSAESSGGAPATRLASTDALALAFDCEAAGDINAQVRGVVIANLTLAHSDAPPVMIQYLFRTTLCSARHGDGVSTPLGYAFGLLSLKSSCLLTTSHDKAHPLHAAQVQC